MKLAETPIFRMIFKEHTLSHLRSCNILSIFSDPFINLATRFTIRKRISIHYFTSFSMLAEMIWIQGSLGRLAANILVPKLKKGEKCPMVILMHGFTGNMESPLLIQIGEKLLESKIASIRFDFNGHGQSEGEFINMTVLNEIEDARKVFEYVAALDYVSDICFLGHSQGGVVSSMLSGDLKSKVKCVVLMAAAAVLKDDALNGTIMGIKYDPKNIPEYIEVHGNKVGRAYFQTAQTLPIYEKSLEYEGPVCIIHGKNDSVVPYSYSERYHSGYHDSELHLLDEEDHSFGHNMDLSAYIAYNYIVYKISSKEPTNNKAHTPLEKNLIITSSVLGVLCLALVVIVVFMFIKSRSNNEYSKYNDKLNSIQQQNLN